ncbi:MAG: O-antigen ligase family protein [Candidatus Moraniibacteriota bacterium]
MKNTKENIAWFWQNAERILIVTFFLTFTLNIRKVFLTPHSFLNGEFNEYMTMSFSWADLLMITTILIYTIKYISSQLSALPHSETIPSNKYNSKSIHSSLTNVSRETFYLLVFLAWIGLSIFWSQYRPIAVYRFFTFIEIVLFAIVATKSLNNTKWLKIAFFAVIINGLFQSLLGIAQFIHNESLGLRILGESIIGSNIEGVAKIIINGEKHIRAYGTFPHPNILAGFLLVPLFIIIGALLSRKLSYLGKQRTRAEPNLSDTLTQDIPSAFSSAEEKKQENVSHETFLEFIPRWALFTILIITGLGFLLTFSRSAFLGLFIGLVILFARISYMRSSRRILKNNFKLSATSIIALMFITILMLTNTSFFSNQSLQERNLYQNVSYETILKHPLAGVGIGQFVISEYQNYPNLESWQYQPVHNIYLLVFSELGIIGLTSFVLFLAIFLYLKSRGVQKYDRLTYLLFCCIVFSFLYISFFDHYFWDIKLGTIIFALPFIIMCVTMKK